VCGALAIACAAAPEPAPLAGWDVILINVDALRADHLGCYGYDRPTSPYLDSLCAGSVVFERAIAASTYTRESVAALFTGKLPSKSGALGWHAQPQPDRATLAERLAAAGYRTALLSNTVMLRKPGFERGFEHVAHLPERWNLSGEGARLSDAAIAWATAADDRPAFLYLHYLDPHAPYEPAAGFLERMGGPLLADPLSLYDDVVPGLPALRVSGFGPGDPRFEDLVRRYDAEIASTDAAIERLVTGLAARGALDRTLIVVTSDHGEEFLEHGWLDHGWTLFDETLRVPLLLWAPGVLEPARVATRVSQVDLAPTLLALLGVEVAADFDGAPIFEREGGSLEPREVERTHVAELLLGRRQILRAVLRDDWKYVAAWREVGADVRHRPGAPAPDPPPALWGEPARAQLFDLGSDPGEQRDRLASEPAAARDLAAALADFRDRGANYGPAPRPAGGDAAGADPAPEMQERLRALGYVE